MKSAGLKLVLAPTAVQSPSNDPIPVLARVARVVALDERGVPCIDFPGNLDGPQVAKLALSAVDAERLARHWQDTEVLIVFAGEDIRQPVITGLVRNSLKDIAYEMQDWEGFRQLVLKAEEELVLQCGDAKIVLRRDGKLTIVGKEILSRALERHRIRGATVAIN